MRGPLVYCLEQADHGGDDVWDLRVPPDAGWEERFEPGLHDGCVVLTTMGQALDAEPAGEELYRGLSSRRQRRRPRRLTAIPYFAWANREPGPMQVWTALT